MPDKSIHFYSLIPEPSMTFNGGVLDKCLPQMFNYCFPRSGSYLSEIVKVSFDIIESNHEYVYGKYSKKKNIKPSAMIQERLLETKETRPVSDDPEKQLENFTYFYILFSHKILAEIHNPTLPGIEGVFSRYIDERYAGTAKLTLRAYATSQEEVKKRIKDVNEIVSIKASFIPDDSSIIRSLEDTLGCESTSYSLKMKIKSRLPNLIDNLFKLLKKENTEALSINTINASGLEEPFDLLKMLVIKKATFELTDDLAFNQKQIKDIITKEISNFVNTYLL